MANFRSDIELRAAETKSDFWAPYAQRIADLERANEEWSSVNSIILRWDARGRVVSINDFGLRLFGYQLDEIVGKSVLGTIVAPIDSQGIDLSQMIDNLLSDPDRYAFNENENVCRDGSKLWVAWRNTPVFDDQGRLREILTVGIDITERKRAEEALEQTRDRLARALREQEAFIEALTDVFYVYDADFRLIRWNSRLQQVSGYGAEELRGQSLDALVTPEEREMVGRQRALIGERGVVCFLAHLLTRDGRRLPFEFTARASEDAAGQGTCYVGTARDMSERLKAEACAAVAQRIAAIEKLVAGLLHELNTPLGVLSCNADLFGSCMRKVKSLLAEVDCPSSIASQLEALMGAADNGRLANLEAMSRIRSLVDDLALFVRLDAPEFGSCALHESLDRAARLVLVHQREGIQLNREYRHTQPIQGRPADLNQVFMTLLTNAVEGLQGKGRVNLRVHAIDSWVEVRIEASNGVQVPVEPPRACELGIHWRADRMASGIGLFGAYHLVRQHGGELAVAAEPETGVVFTVRLPVSPGCRDHKSAPHS